MRYSYFEVRNFKGVESAKLDLSVHPRGRIFTLVGLNESGKTTLLEAINFLTYKAESLDPLSLPGYVTADVHDIIPISKRANFNEQIVITAGVELTEDDREAIREFILRECDGRVVGTIQPFTITQSYKFENSTVLAKQPTSTWSFAAKLQKRKQRKARPLAGDDWQKVSAFIRGRLPSVLYFPNFLFDFPDRIYLDEPPSDAERHEFFRRIVQDILDAVGGGIKWETHILERARSGSRADKQALESVLLKMGAHTTKHVFDAWNKIFKRSAAGKELVVGYDQDEAGLWYLQFRLKEANEPYSVSERSLGFRWFFTYLLLTYYRGLRAGDARQVLFLLDEPASNLHPSAQTQLLNSFGRMPENCDVVYTTHSHHLISPEWLDNAFVVKNEGLSYDAEDHYAVRNTNIVVERYRAFASLHPDQSTYFQPILDVLDYSPGLLENVPDVVMTEGKNDYYILKFFGKILGRTDLHIVPGGAGASGLDSVMRLYLGWARNFLVLLDGDSEGLAQRRRYEEVFGAVVQERIMTLGDIDAKWQNKAMEAIIAPESRLILQRLVYPADTRYSKSHFARAVQELFLRKVAYTPPTEVAETFENLLDALRDRLRSLGERPI